MTERAAMESGSALSRVSALLRMNVFSFRGLVRKWRGRRSWQEEIDRAALPEAVSSAVGAIVERAKLWEHERAEVARELCSHAAEALSAGRDTGAVARDLGEPRVVARLIHRSMKRKRGKAWQIWVWGLRGTGGVAMLMMTMATVMVGRFYLGEPTPTRNFIAEMNAPIERYSEDERAWPLLREAWATFGPRLEAVREATRAREEALVAADPDADIPASGLEILPGLIEPDHPDYALIMKTYEASLGELELMRLAGARPIMGRLYSYLKTEAPTDPVTGKVSDQGFISEPIPAPEDPAQQEWLISVLLPELNPARMLTKWLAFDAGVRAQQGDGSGAADSIVAAVGIADHYDHGNLLIEMLVGMSIERFAIDAVSDIMARDASVFSDKDLVRLAHVLGTPRFERLALDGEKMFFDDFLQRSFTDDGNGDGVFTAEGYRLLGDGVNLAGGGDNLTPPFVNVALMASRREISEMHTRFFDQYRAEEAAGYALYREPIYKSDAMVESLYTDPVKGERYKPLTALLPALGSAIGRNLERRALVEACVAGIAAELYRRETGAFPAELTELVPRYLPQTPEDPFTGGVLRISVRDGGAVIYAVGPDGDDDGGDTKGSGYVDLKPRLNGVYSTTVNRGGKWETVNGPADGDWVLYPSGKR